MKHICYGFLSVVLCLWGTGCGSEKQAGEKLLASCEELMSYADRVRVEMVNLPKTYDSPGNKSFHFDDLEERRAHVKDLSERREKFAANINTAKAKGDYVTRSLLAMSGTSCPVAGGSPAQPEYNDKIVIDDRVVAYWKKNNGKLLNKAYEKLKEVDDHLNFWINYGK